jgi:hypothetical protein
LVLFIYIYITRLASNEIFSPSNKIHGELGRAKDLSAPPYKQFLFALCPLGLRKSQLLVTSFW